MSRFFSLFKSIVIISFFAVLFFLFFAIKASQQKMSIIDFGLTHLARQNFSWECTMHSKKNLTQNGSVHWLTFSCRVVFPIIYLIHSGQKTQTLTINIIDANLADPNIQLTPVVARAKSPPSKLLYAETLLQMGHDNPGFIAGINGGYFFMNRPGHGDLNCLGKHYPELTSSGISDGLLVLNKQPIAENCFWGSLGAKSVRSSLVENVKQKWHIQQIPAGKSPAFLVNALGAGPGLIETNNGKPEIVVRWEGIPSTFEFSANTAVALAKDKNNNPHVLFITIDGIDKKMGMDSAEMANFIYYVIPRFFHLKLHTAMSMDQGHSTTMYVRDAKPQIVSSSSKGNNVRPIYDGLFIRELS